MARRKAKPAPTPAIAYKVVRHSCWHRGEEYKVGDILPAMTLAELNTHLINVELVEAEGEPTPEPEPETEEEAEEPKEYDVLF